MKKLTDVYYWVKVIVQASNSLKFSHFKPSFEGLKNVLSVRKILFLMTSAPLKL